MQPNENFVPIPARPHPLQAFQQEKWQRIWSELVHLPRLESVAEIQRGLEDALLKEQSEAQLLPSESAAVFVKGVSRADFEPYIVKSTIYRKIRRGQSLSEGTVPNWEQPKVILTAHPNAATPHWPIAAAVDTEGLICPSSFYGIWPRGPLPSEVLAALLNSAVANALLATQPPSRENPLHLLQKMPIPSFEPWEVHQITSLVRRYRATREEWRKNEAPSQFLERACGGILKQLDWEILRLYHLPLQAERDLLAHFEGHRRPGPVPLTKVEPSRQNRLWDSLIEVENVRGEGNDKIMDIVILGCDHEQPLHLPLSLVPQKLWGQIAQDVYLLAKINIATKEAKNLVFEDIRLAPAVKDNLRDRFESFANTAYS